MRNVNKEKIQTPLSELISPGRSKLDTQTIMSWKKITPATARMETGTRFEIREKRKKAKRKRHEKVNVNGVWNSQESPDAIANLFYI